jgi:GntR family transcriptional regulator
MAAPSAAPRYLTIADHLRTLIASGAPGDLLPSDAELCERFEVSRMTARNAVQVLVTEGLVYRRRGQGTFIASSPIPRLLGSPLSFTESTRRRGLEPSSRVLASGLFEATVEQLEALRLEAGSEVVLLERLRFADRVPMALERAVLIPVLATVLSGDLVHGSLHHAMEQAGYPPVRARAHVSARLATPREHRLLDTSSDGIVLCERRVILDTAGRPVEHTETCYAAERYSFELVEHRDGSAGT